MYICGKKPDLLVKDDETWLTVRLVFYIIELGATRSSVEPIAAAGDMDTVKKGVRDEERSGKSGGDICPVGISCIRFCFECRWKRLLSSR